MISVNGCGIMPSKNRKVFQAEDARAKAKTGENYFRKMNFRVGA